MITVNDTGVQVVIGRAGENVFRTIQVDVSAWLSDYPDCQITAVFRRPDGVGYAVPLERWGESVVWKPTETDTVRQAERKRRQGVRPAGEGRPFEHYITQRRCPNGDPH